MKLDRFVLLMGGVLAGLFGLLVGGVALSSSAAAPGLPALGQPGAEPAATEGCPLSGQPVLVFYDDFESGAPGWSSVGPGNTWAVWSRRAHSGTLAYHADTPGSITDQRLISPPIAVPNTALPLYFTFWHYRNLEDSPWGSCYDAALLEVSTDGGASRQPVDGGALPVGCYDSWISSFTNPLYGLNGWCGNSQTWGKAS